MRRLLLLLLPLTASCSLFASTATPVASGETPATSTLVPPTVTPVAHSETPALPTSTATDAPTQIPPATGFPNPSEYTWSLVADSFTRPVDLVHANDSRLFVVEQRGMIWILQGGNRLETPFLDIRERVNDAGNEQGLLSLAFHPGFPENRSFFVYYTGSGGDTFISRFQVSADPDLAEANSESVLLTINQPFRNHNGGALKFGPDGYLYIGTGDGGSQGDPQGNGQRLDTLLGKILRIDVDDGDPYAIPPDNPFADSEGRDEIWAYGLRNPWRISFDRSTGDLYIGDVGQSQWEEINFQPASSQGGTNFGWNFREAAHPYASNLTEGLTDPIAEYGHGSGCSVTGGFAVRSPSLPEWSGIYLFGDYCSGTIWGLLHTETGGWEMRSLFETGERISSFGEDSQSEIYLIAHGGRIFRLEALP